MRPPVSFRPVDQLFSVVDQSQRPCFDIGVEPFFDQDFRLACRGIGHADVDAVKVTAGAGKVKLIRSLRKPEARPIFIIAVFRQTWCCKDRNSLVFELFCIDLDFFLGFKFKDQDFINRRFFLTRHLVSVCFQCRAGLGDRIDNPKVFDLPFVCSGHRKLIRVPGPDDPDSLAFILVFLFVDIGHASSFSVVAVAFFSISGELMLDDILVIFVFQSFLVVGFVHIEEVVVTAENDGLSVWRDGGPSGSFRWFFIVFEQSEFSRGEIILEIEDLFLGFFFFLWRFFFLFFLFFLLFLVYFFFFLLLFLFFFFFFFYLFFFFFLRTFNLKLDGPVFFYKFYSSDRQMFRVVRILGDQCQFGGHCVVVEYRPFCFSNRVHD